MSQEVTGPETRDVYHFRALATNLNGTTAGPDMTFVTPDRPEVGGLTVSGVTATGATLSAKIAPGTGRPHTTSSTGTPPHSA